MSLTDCPGSRQVPDGKPPVSADSTCALSKPLLPCRKGVVIEPLFNSTIQGGVKCGRVCTCLCIVFSILENSQTAERGEIRVITSNWSGGTLAFHTEGNCGNLRANRERVHCFTEGVGVEREGGDRGQ